MVGLQSSSSFSRTSYGSNVEDDASLHVDLDGDSTKAGMSHDNNAENLDLKNETRKTSVIRCLVITTLLTSAAIVANVALVMALNEEEVEFKAEYTRLSNRVIENFLDSFGEKISAADSMASQLYFKDEQTEPHLFSIPEFELQAEGIRQLSTSTTVSYAPILQGQQQRRQFEAYANLAFDEEARSKFESTYLPHDGKYNFGDDPLVTYVETGDRKIEDGIYRVDDGSVVADESAFFLAPVWQVAPFNSATGSSVMFNQMSEKQRNTALGRLIQQKGYVISDIHYNSTVDSLHADYAAPLLALYYPISRDIVNDKTSLVGALTFEVGLESLFEGVLQGFEDEPITAVVETSCGSEYSFLIRGDQVTFLGNGDLHENIPDVGVMEFVSSSYGQFDEIVRSLAESYPTTGDILCSYKVSMYPTVDSYTYYLTNRPVIIEGIVGLVFLFTVSVFLGYDCLVERRQRRMLAAAQRTNALVSSLFPQAVRDRLYNQAAAKKQRKLEAAPKLRLKTFMAKDSKAIEAEVVSGYATEPIADLFPIATILFSDISGFSAWASEREPSQVFTLLETFFTSFDTIARRLGVFKVETVGDCYVAATGVPQARDDHAVAMVRFANAILLRANALSKALESTLGPGTGDLTMRVGIHSGSVTAGVLRGEKSRFQLFGDTMNMASRMESTGDKGTIQLSTETANLLIDAGKAHWIEPREDLVEAKGKGTMQTYWLKLESKAGAEPTVGAEFNLDVSVRETYETKERLIDWNLKTMLSLVERIIASRGKRRLSRIERDPDLSLRPKNWKVMEEVQEVVEFARFDSQAVLRAEKKADIPPLVRSELRDYIAQISSLYLDNPFHNFDHASHVTMSCHKLFKRINRPDEVDYSNADMEKVAYELHEATYGLSSDPLTQLAIVIAALIHDAGHRGVPNGQLAKEHPTYVAKYGRQSLAEQRSLDISLELLEAPCYSNLRACIIPTKEEQERFSQLIINTVLATDIFDKDLGALRKARWAEAFGRDDDTDEDASAMDRKATIVLEHVIQASDVAHTMQHWKIYQKWNQCLYEEMYKAYKEGRSENDPTLGWYKGELWFFDNYVIPLAKKLKDCGVFGISSDEYLHYATENRNEWEQKGEAMVARMEKKVKEPEMLEDED